MNLKHESFKNTNMSFVWLSVSRCFENSTKHLIIDKILISYEYGSLLIQSAWAVEYTDRISVCKQTTDV